MLRATERRQAMKTMGRPRRDLTGQIFGLLHVISFADSTKRGSRFLCVCECGRTKVCSGDALIKGANKSCGWGCPLRVGRIGHLANQHHEESSPHVTIPEREPWTYEGDEAALAAQYGDSANV